MLRIFVLVSILFLTVLTYNVQAEIRLAPLPISPVTQQLIEAIDDGDTDKVMNILETTAFPQNKSEQLLLLMNAMGNHASDDFSIARQLIQRGADVNEIIRLEDFPLKEKEAVVLPDSAESVQSSQNIDDEEDLEKTFMDRATVLMFASMAYDIRPLRFLIEQGADVNFESAGGYTSLAIATANYLYNRHSEQCREILIYLLDHNADPWHNIKILPSMEMLSKLRNVSFDFVTLAGALNDKKLLTALNKREIYVTPTETSTQLAEILKSM